nr:MarR family winged helix-turn-helix transcriptional regulator [Streptomyces sp. HNM0574]
MVPGTVGEHASCLLLKLGQVVFRLSEAELVDEGLRVRHYSILQALADNGAMSQLALGAFLRIDPATMVSSLDDLERAGLAARERDPQDRRRYVVDATAAGREALSRVNGTLDELDGRALADLTPAERKTLHRLLTKLSAGPTLPALFDGARS